MKIAPLFLLLLSFKISYAQQNTRFTFKEVGWTINLPSDFVIIDSLKNEKINEKGKKAMEESNNLQIDISQTKTLISATKDQFNYFNATITPYDVAKEGNYEEATIGVKAVLYKTFADKMPDAVIDSVSTTTVIDGLSFDKFQVVLKVDNKLLFTMVLLSKLYRNLDFGISYLFLDEVTKFEMERILQTSKFSK